ncbi:prophage tail fiber N-terminal domain-containing protein [Salmonella enterica]|nr:prophage tail fiber N-terminal domain-containing protein [Salmonella enterica]
MPIISGVLKDGAGQPIAGCTIQLKAVNTTSAVIMTTTARVGATAGEYRIEALPARYEVTLAVEGYPPQKVGVIDVYADSKDGTLNDFLTAVTGDYLKPDVMTRFEQMVQQAQDAATQAGKSVEGITDKINELNEKSDTSLQSITEKTTASLGAVDTRRDEAVSAIDKKQSDATSAIQAGVTAAGLSEKNAAAAEEEIKKLAQAVTDAAGTVTAARDAVAGSETAAKNSEEQAASSAAKAGASEKAAAQHVTDAGNLKTSAQESAAAAQKSASDAATHDASAQTAATNAAASAAGAEKAAQDAKQAAETAAGNAVSSAVPAAVKQIKDEIAGDVTRAEGAVTKAETASTEAQQALKEAQEIAKTPGPEGAPGKDGEPGAPGKDGAPGAPGKSAWDIWKEKQAAGADTSEEAYIKFQEGKPGRDGAPGKDGAPGQPGKDAGSSTEWLGVGSYLLAVFVNRPPESFFSGEKHSEDGSDTWIKGTVSGSDVVPVSVIESSSSGNYCRLQNFTATGTWRVLGPYTDHSAWDDDLATPGTTGGPDNTRFPGTPPPQLIVLLQRII